MVREFIEGFNKQGIGVYFTGLIGPVRDFLMSTAFTEEVGKDHFFIDVQSAIDYLDDDSKKRSKQMISFAVQNNIFKEKEI